MHNPITVLKNIWRQQLKANRQLNDMTIRMNNQVEQRLLFQSYGQLNKQSFDSVGFREYSQTNEDGILLYIFSQIGFGDRRCLDIAFATPFGSNVTNLLSNWGFTGLLIEGKSLEASRIFFNEHPDTRIHPPKLVKAWITKKNINSLIKKNSITGNIDLLSLDVDGVDYWLWESLTVASPRVVVLEFANYIPADKSLTVPYKDDFVRSDIHLDFMGASLKAFIKLAKKKGYTFVGTNLYGFNAFFVRNDQPLDWYSPVSIKQALSHHQAQEGLKNRWPSVKDLPWIEV